MNVMIQDFIPLNQWTEVADGPKWNDGQPKYVRDQSPGRCYWNESKNIVRFKCALLALGTPIVHGIIGLVNIFYRFLKLITLANFWLPKSAEKCSFKARLMECAADFARMYTASAAIFCLQISAIFGIFSPFNGRKLYASFERAQYNRSILAPCFQPNPRRHFLGGDPSTRNTF